MNRSSVAAIEEGRTNAPGEDTLAKIETALQMPPNTLGAQLTAWSKARAAEGPILTPVARAVLAMSPAEVANFTSFVDWRERIAPSVTAFAAMLGLNRTVAAKYEQGARTRGMPATLSHAILSTLHVSDAYLLALQDLEPAEDEL